MPVSTKISVSACFSIKFLRGPPRTISFPTRVTVSSHSHALLHMARECTYTDVDLRCAVNLRGQQTYFMNSDLDFRCVLMHFDLPRYNHRG